MTPLQNEAEHVFSRTLHRAAYGPIAGLLVFVLLLLGMIAYLVNVMGWVDHTNRVIAESLDAEKKLLDVQTGLRGYLLTFDPEQLQPVSASRPAVPAALAKLRGLVADNAAQEQRAARLSSGVDAWLTLVDQALDTARQHGVRPTPEHIRRGSELFDTIRRDLSDFQSVEFSLRDQRTARSINIAVIVVSVALLLALAVGLWQAVATRRGLQLVTSRFREAIDVGERQREQIKQVVRDLDVELQAVADIQRSLLPIKLPNIPTLQLAASYQTSKRAGGDYYDFFRLPEDESVPADQARWGILIADVSGHGTPAAVLMAVTHAITHGIEGPLDRPGHLLSFVNERLCASYTVESTAFVTAFFGIYTPATRSLEYSSAGHNPPRLLRSGESKFIPLEDAQALPLGIEPSEQYPDAAIRLNKGDTLVLYTDGWTEARPPGSTELFGVDRLDQIFLTRRDLDPTGVMEGAIGDLDHFTQHHPPQDDRTLLVLRASPRGHDDGEHTVSILAGHPTLLESVEALVSPP